MIATSYLGNFDIPRSQTTFWVADGDGAMEMRLYNDEIMEGDYPAFAVQVGQKISFRVTRVGRYYDKGQVEAASDWVLGEFDQNVYVMEPDRELTVADVHQLVRVTGILEGDPSTCGGSSKCWSFDYGHGAPAIFRTSSTIVDTGLVSLRWPVDLVPPQFNVDNFDRLRVSKPWLLSPHTAGIPTCSGLKSRLGFNKPLRATLDGSSSK